ncbi:hypothetical protein LPJ81_004292 [Coemansia sp. IMI 209127]|nr:hypothetical protein LPJ81_004292 [Coemansia sp. IMI 209127]
MFFRPCKMNSFSESPVDMPPADWCITTLQTLNNKYERITDSRKVNHPFAEAVLNSFKSKLLNLVSSQSFYDSDVSDEDAEWTPLPSDNTFDSTTSNYISIPSSSSGDVSDISSCYDTNSLEETDDDITACISSPLPSPTGIAGDNVYLGTSADFTAPQPPSFDTTVSSEFVTLPPNIEEALRRILANTNGQALSDTFTTFANTSDTTTLTTDAASAISSACRKSEDDGDNGAEDDDEEEEEDDDSRFVSDSGNCSPDSLDSPEGSMDYMTTEDSVDIFVKTFTANGGWEAVENQSKSAAAAVTAAASADNGNFLTPCKRKRSSEAEDLPCGKAAQDKNSIPRNKAIISPRKRSRSVNHNDAAAVPTAEGRVKSAGTAAANSTNSSSPVSHPSSPSSTPPISPLLAMAITTGSDKSSSSD